ncbi:MAG: hypothetical protein AB1779_01470 [Candidatus Thermoplasmatota archaeon]
MGYSKIDDVELTLEFKLDDRLPVKMHSNEGCLYISEKDGLIKASSGFRYNFSFDEITNVELLSFKPLQIKLQLENSEIKISGKNGSKLFFLFDRFLHHFNKEEAELVV